jgi:hypothetical protein
MTVSHSLAAVDDHGVSYIQQYIAQQGQSARCEFTPLKGRILKLQGDVGLGGVVISDGPLHIVRSCPENPAWGKLEKILERRKFDFDALWYWTALTSFTELDASGCPDLPTVSEETQTKLLLLHHDIVSIEKLFSLVFSESPL